MRFGFTDRARVALDPDFKHTLSHFISLTGDNDGCDICARWREKAAAWELEHPECDCDCCDH